MNITTKFGSLEVDIYNSTYGFSKLAYISEINELVFKSTATVSWGPWVSRAHGLVTENRAPALIGQSLLTTSAPQWSPRHSAHTGLAS